MPLNLDSCITGIFVPGNIGASSGLAPVRPIVPSLDGDPPAIVETATATHAQDAEVTQVMGIEEVAAAAAMQDATVVAVPRSAMVPWVFVNGTTSRQAYVGSVMVNL